MSYVVDPLSALVINDTLRATARTLRMLVHRAGDDDDQRWFVELAESVEKQMVSDPPTEEELYSLAAFSCLFCQHDQCEEICPLREIREAIETARRGGRWV